MHLTCSSGTGLEEGGHRMESGGVDWRKVGTDLSTQEGEESHGDAERDGADRHQRRGEEEDQESHGDAVDYLNSVDKLFVNDQFLNWDPENRIKVRIISARAYHSLFMHNMYASQVTVTVTSLQSLILTVEPTSVHLFFWHRRVLY